MSAGRLDTQFIHLGLGATAETLPPFTGMEWYEAYGARAAADGAEGRLVSQYTFTESWTAWELHPAGAEVVICTYGAMVLIQESPDGQQTEIALTAGDYAINPPGVWHTADVAESATAIFITAGEGTTHRPR
ncbi:MAG TPA: cupin [Erythrobacter sp.]|nr:cupin [Erythrobacter sp.]